MKSQLPLPGSRFIQIRSMIALTALLAGLLNIPQALAADTGSDNLVGVNLVGVNAGAAALSGLSEAEAQQRLYELRQAARAEAKLLSRLSETKLKNLAEQGNTLAQLVLAETFATEAHTSALTIGAANAALGDALYWYSLAAKRGYPGAISIDKILPAFPVRIIRGP